MTNQQNFDYLKVKLAEAIGNIKSAKTNLSHYGTMKDFNHFLEKSISILQDVHKKTKGTF